MAKFKCETCVPDEPCYVSHKGSCDTPTKCPWGVDDEIIWELVKVVRK